MTTVMIAMLVLGLAGLILGALLGYAAHRFNVESDPIVEKIEALLPQSQCGQCGYPGCRPYAEAIGQHNEAINKCAPGGEKTMQNLATLLNIEPQPIGETILAKSAIKTVAWIDEANCIGCMKCIHACPMDAIVGTTRAVHTVLADFCTGCDLCLTPCPTDCIEMRPVSVTSSREEWKTHPIPIRLLSA